MQRCLCNPRRPIQRRQPRCRTGFHRASRKTLHGVIARITYHKNDRALLSPGCAPTVAGGAQAAQNAEHLAVNCFDLVPRQRAQLTRDDHDPSQRVDNCANLGNLGFGLTPVSSSSCPPCLGTAQLPYTEKGCLAL